MTVPLLLLASALAAGQGSGTCHVVGNQGIVTIPCDSSRSDVSAAEAKAQGAPRPPAQGAGTPARPQGTGTAAQPQGVGARAQGEGGAGAGVAQGTGVTPEDGAEEEGAAALQEGGEAAPARPAAGSANGVGALQQEVERLRRERQTAEAERAQAERDRQSAVDELTGIRQELAVSRERTEQAEQARSAQLADLDSTATALANADGALATGSAGDAEAVLARAGDVLEGVHSRDGSAWVAAAKDALARSDYAAARRAIQYAARAAAQAQPASPAPAPY